MALLIFHLTFGTESCIFHVNNLTLRAFGAGGGGGGGVPSYCVERGTLNGLGWCGVVGNSPCRRAKTFCWPGMNEYQVKVPENVISMTLARRRLYTKRGCPWPLIPL